MGLALVTRIVSLSEAHIAVGVLRSGGIDAELFDVNFGRVEAPVIESLGGYRVMAPEQEVAAAREALRALRSTPAPVDPEEMSPWEVPAPSVGGGKRLGMKIVAGLFLASPFLIWLMARLARAETP